MIKIQQMNENDLDKVMIIQSLAYIPQYCENMEVYRDKLDKFPFGCWIAEIDGEIIGYLISHPYLIDNPPKLDSTIDDIPKNPDCYFIHDVAVNPDFRDKGIGKILCEKAKSLAKEHNLNNMALISVQNSHPFWEKMGFSISKKLSAKMIGKLKSYETDEFPEPKLMTMILH